MSFFNSLQQYVTSGVAGLGLSPRRFSLSRPEANDTALQERRESNNSQQPGKFQCHNNIYISLSVNLNYDLISFMSYPMHWTASENFESVQCINV